MAGKAEMGLQSLCTDLCEIHVIFPCFLALQGGPAGSALQQAAQVVYAKLKGLWPRKMEAVVSAELWAHCRQPSSPHQLHFDTDETRLGPFGVQADNLIHPVSPYGLRIAPKFTSVQACPVIPQGLMIR